MQIVFLSEIAGKVPSVLYKRLIVDRETVYGKVSYDTLNVR
jgi:hypothetical protein